MQITLVRISPTESGLIRISMRRCVQDLRGIKRCFSSSGTTSVSEKKKKKRKRLSDFSSQFSYKIRSFTKTGSRQI
jgi:hypothetical protein